MGRIVSVSAYFGEPFYPEKSVISKFYGTFQMKDEVSIKDYRLAFVPVSAIVIGQSKSGVNAKFVKNSVAGETLKGLNLIEEQFFYGMQAWIAKGEYVGEASNNEYCVFKNIKYSSIGSNTALHLKSETKPNYLDLVLNQIEMFSFGYLQGMIASGFKSSKETECFGFITMVHKSVEDKSIIYFPEENVEIYD